MLASRAILVLALVLPRLVHAGQETREIERCLEANAPRGERVLDVTLEQGSAQEVLSRIKSDERHFLNALHDTVDRGETQAEELLARYHGDWAGDVTKVFGEYSY